MTAPFTLLLVSTDENRREELTRIIAETNTFENVICVANSNEAVAVLKKRNISFLISEINIGTLDGWRLSRMIRSEIFIADKETPIILLTPTYCERIADTTARIFGINAVLAYEHLEDLPEAVQSGIQRHNIRSEKLPLLVIEDTEDTAELAKRILSNRFDVDIAPDGILGLEMFRRNKYAIILLDVMLPGMSGQEVLDIILQESPHQSVVIMTAHGNMDLAEELMIQGAVDYIQKPFQAEQLRKVCEIASRREDFMVSNQQFAEKVRALQESESNYRDLSQIHQRLLNHLSTVIMELDTSGRIRFVNQAWENLTGYTTKSAMNNSLYSYLSPSSQQTKFTFNRILNQLLAGKLNSDPLEFKLSHHQGKEIWVEGRFDLLTLEDDTITGITATIDDITARKDAEQQLQHLASHDKLTGLRNRYYFDGELARLTLVSWRNKSRNCLLYIDLDHFKVINDTQGHQQGDMVLKEVANSLTRRLRSSDILCRIGGDEFAVLLYDTEIDTATTIANEICSLIEKGHYQFDDKIYKISCSVGITEVNGQTQDPQEYLKQADIALYVAKNRGRNLVHCYSPDDKESDDFRNSVEWSHKLQEAIVNDNIVLHFQPVVNIRTGETEYYEALVRLMLDNQLIFPGQFIPALERAEDINILDHQVVSKAIYMLSVHDDLRRIAINLSAQAFSDVRLVPLIEDKLEHYGVEPNRIIFELTESASLTNLSATRRMIARLTEIGCEFSIDDFGTGFSTFAYLKELPAHSVKIDGSFVKDMVADSIDSALVKAIHDVAKALKKKSVAEFVESKEIFDRLKQIGVDYAQGYYISKPLPIDEVMARNRELISS